MAEKLTELEDTKESGPRPKRRRWLRTLCGMAIAFLVVFFVFLGAPLRISKETTYITEPLKSNGKEVDYFAAIRNAVRPDNAATDENGFRLIVRHLGCSPDCDPPHFARVCQELGLDASKIRPDMTYVEPSDALKAYVESEEFDKMLLDELPPDDRCATDAIMMLDGKLDRPWTLDELPMMAQWLEDNAPALDLVGRAVRMPVFHIPLVRESENDPLIGVDLSETYHMRSFARGLRARANHRIALGDLDGAIHDMITCQRLGRHVGRGAMSIGMLVGIACEQIGRQIGIAGSFEHPPTKEQLQRLVAEIEALPPEADLDRIALFERFAGLDGIQSLASGRFPDDEEAITDGRMPRILRSYALDWNVVARRYNEDFDTLWATGEEPPDAASGLWAALSFVTVRSRSKFMADMMSGLSLPSWNAIQEAARRATCTRQMNRVTLAMLLYERDHGTLPPVFSVDSNGNPLHGWRVLLLPYLGQQALFERIRLDEPWGSEHNRQFHDKDMAIYRCPSDPTAKPGQATYSVVVGPDMPFQAGQGKKLADFGPLSDDMILLVERAHPAGWMDPTREIPQAAAEEGIRQFTEPFAPVPPSPNGIGSHHAGIANFGVRGGAVRCVDVDIDLEVLRAMLRGTNTEKSLD